jgi:hypothetical protein
MTDPLQNEVKTFKNRLTKDYLDKLDGRKDIRRVRAREIATPAGRK